MPILLASSPFCDMYDGHLLLNLNWPGLPLRLHVRTYSSHGGHDGGWVRAGAGDFSTDAFWCFAMALHHDDNAPQSFWRCFMVPSTITAC